MVKRICLRSTRIRKRGNQFDIRQIRGSPPPHDLKKGERREGKGS